MPSCPITQCPVPAACEAVRGELRRHADLCLLSHPAHGRRWDLVPRGGERVVPMEMRTGRVRGLICSRLRWTRALRPVCLM